jgi:hypothetical protein
MGDGGGRIALRHVGEDALQDFEMAHERASLGPVRTGSIDYRGKRPHRSERLDPSKDLRRTRFGRRFRS